MEKFNAFFDNHEEELRKAFTIVAAAAGLAIDFATWYVAIKSRPAVFAVIVANRLIMGSVLVKEGYVDEAIDTLNWLVS